MKRFLTIVIVLLSVLQASAVLKEKDLGQTLQILRAELTEFHHELSKRMEKDHKL